MNKGIILLGILVTALLTGCSGEIGNKANAENASPAAIEVKSDRIQGEPLVGEKFTYVERDRHPGEGYYYCPKNEFAMQVYEANDEYALLAFSDDGLYPFLARAEKNKRDEYEFFFSTTGSYSEYQTVFSAVQIEKEKALYDVSFRLQEDDILLNIRRTTNDVKSMYHSLSGIHKLLKQENEEQVEVCDLTRCLGKCQDVYQSVYTKDMRFIEIGKERGSDKVSYVEVDFESGLKVEEKEDKRARTEEIKRYQMGHITCFSNKEDCDQEFGEPVSKTDDKRVYSYEDGYVIEVVFDGTYIKRMGIYQGSRDEAMKTYAEGEFFLRGCRITDAKKCYLKGGNIELPEDIIAIASEAFGAENITFSTQKKVKIEIPKDVYLEPLAFSWAGKMEITFEEGRKKIERYAFQNMGGERGSRVTLPNSIRKIEEYAFDQKLGRWRIGLHFREGVRVIEEYALRDVTGNLPSTVKIIKEGALEGWTPRNGNYTLPRDLEEIGNCCITVPRGKTIVIPASVKMIGFNAFLYEDYQTPHIVVAYGNKHFKIGKNNWLYSMDGKEVYVAWDYEDDLKIPKGVEYFLCEPVMGENESYEEIIYSESYKGNLYAEYLLNTQGEVEFEY